MNINRRKAQEHKLPHPAADAQLNANQQKAAHLPHQQVLMITGPISSKTRALTHQIANLTNLHNVQSHHILAMTFTNAGRRRT